MNIDVSNEYAQVTMYTPENGSMVRKVGRTKIKATIELDKFESENDYLEFMNTLEKEYYSFMKEPNSRTVTISMTSQLIQGILYHQPIYTHSANDIDPRIFGKDVNGINELGLKCILEVSWPTV